MKHLLAQSVWPAIPERPLVLVPVGSIEQHGPHLPLNTDAVIAEAVAARAAKLLDGQAMVAPLVTYGSSGEHQMFPGTCSIGTEVLRQLLVELARSMRIWAARVVFVNGHGGNLDALVAAVVQMRADDRVDIVLTPCAVGDLKVDWSPLPVTANRVGSFKPSISCPGQVLSVPPSSTRR